MKIGIIGCGRITVKHIDSLNQIEEIEITSLSDLSIERMKQATEQISFNKKPTLYIDYLDLLKSDCDLVLVATTSGSHADITEAALLAGKHVLVEKPLALSLAESKKLIKLANDSDKKLFICHQLRFRLILKEIKALIDSGKLGTIHLGTASMALQRPSEYYKAAPWRGTWDQDGGMLINQGIHLVDLLLWYMGELSEVTGQLKKLNKHKETEDIALGLLRFKNGSTGIIEANAVTWPKNHGYCIKLIADHGTIILEGRNFDLLTRATIKGEPWSGKDVGAWLEKKDEQEQMYKEVLKSMQGKQNNAVTAQEAEGALEAIFALYQSHKQGHSTVLPLSSFATSDMKGVL
ncbi:Gfo/Idh/MocA family protein [Alkalicoccobacillus porphyridii]|uniref:Gfo/Idh/MocA family oxidoreductase n=1 Tax=Alkalicoccobacillus porphyridii TaxID=2597270 RepID=A0A553ZXK5_9BACI|nr:Gfo/Idh/MocA family oxidoreductase [Alkalicoccobacillus porphyridii]TSB46086.1 Gfo/Idh/MocA family oxidoreductase [Alkalicoccobacillus porphyridii]